MLECRRIRLLWGLSEIFKRVIKIFWGEVFMVRNTMKTGQPFLVAISEACSRRSDCRYSGKRCEQKKKKKTRGWGGGGEVCERLNWKFHTLSVSLFSSFFFSLSSFAPHSTIETPGTNYNFGRDASAPPPQVETLLFDWFWSCLTDQSQLARAEYVLYCSTLQKTGHRLSAWNKRNHRTRKKTSASDLTENFHSIFRNYFFPSHSVSLGRSVVYHLQKV